VIGKASAAQAMAERQVADQVVVAAVSSALITAIHVVVSGTVLV
jgi:hypothetical protein